tara:strand:+ start:278 stop:598 length:321 start_codon:yes stop_codon:yes gene_type:complete
MSLIKSKLIEKIIEANPHLYLRDGQRLVDTVFQEITNSLAAGHRVELRGFGAFSVQHRKARIGRNPRSGETVAISEKFICRFKQGKSLRVQLNSEKNASDNQKEED